MVCFTQTMILYSCKINTTPVDIIVILNVFVFMVMFNRTGFTSIIFQDLSKSRWFKESVVLEWSILNNY